MINFVRFGTPKKQIWKTFLTLDYDARKKENKTNIFQI